MGDSSYGLTAYGRSGGVELSIEESLKTPGKYFLTMVIGQLDICFSIADPGTADSLCQFAEAYHGQKKHKEIKLGDLAGLPVYLVKDDEYADRFIIRASGGNGNSVFVKVVDPLARDLVVAAGQLLEDL